MSLVNKIADTFLSYKLLLSIMVLVELFVYKPTISYSNDSLSLPVKVIISPTSKLVIVSSLICL